MTAQFKDLQHADNPLNNRELAAASELFRSLRGRSPFLFKPSNSQGFMLTVGFADACGSVQYSASDGSPPYLMARSQEAADDDGFQEFLAGNTSTPVPRLFCLPISSVEQIVAEFSSMDVNPSW